MAYANMKKQHAHVQELHSKKYILGAQRIPKSAPVNLKEVVLPERTFWQKFFKL
jgi:hypothetical protein